MSPDRRMHRLSPAFALVLLFSTPGVLTPTLSPAASASPDELATLIGDVAEANQRLDELGAAIQLEQEAVNKALVDVQTARDEAAAAQRELEASQLAIEDSNAAIEEAQRKYNRYAIASYMSGPSRSYLSASNPDDLIAAATAGHTLRISTERVLNNLRKARTEQVNRESLARAAKEKADQAAADAQASQDQAVAALTDAQHKFAEQRTQIDRLAAERDAARVKLAAARSQLAPAAAPTSGPAGAPSPQAAPGPAAGTPAPAPAAGNPDWDRGPTPAQAPPFGDVSQWDTTLPMVPSAFVSGDPVAIVNAVLQISATSAQVTADLGRKFLEKVGILKPADTGINNGQIPRVYGRQASEYVIQRGMSQMGVPYSWGGGNAAGPSRGIDSGANTVGFDCSGLVLYAFAGVGIKLPHYSGSQYKMGRQIPSSQMRRGDVIFYGPGGSQHVTIYLGNGQMLEAPYTGSHVKVSPVRTSGMTPFVVRYIEY